MSLPAGYSSPAFANTPEDRGGWAVVSSGVGLVFILLFASLRLYTRYPFRSRLLYDDLAIIISTAVAIIESALVIAAVSYGLGKSTRVLEPDERDPTEKLLYAGDIFYLIATFSSRTALICLLYALSPERLNKRVTKSAIIASLLMTVAAVLMLALGCNPGSPWTQLSQECTSVYKRWIAIVVLSISLELFVIAVVLRMLFMLQNHWTGKLKAIMVFTLRLPIIVIAIYRLLSLRDFRASTDPFLDRIVIVAWTQGEMTYSIVTAILPTLMPFLIKLNTGLGAFSRDDFIKQTTHQESGGSYVMQSLRSPQSGSRMRSDNVNFQSMVVSGKEPRRSISSDDSQRVMVRKSVDVSYSVDDRINKAR